MMLRSIIGLRLVADGERFLDSNRTTVSIRLAVENSPEPSGGARQAITATVW